MYIYPPPCLVPVLAYESILTTPEVSCGTLLRRFLEILFRVSLRSPYPPPTSKCSPLSADRAVFAKNLNFT